VVTAAGRLYDHSMGQLKAVEIAGYVSFSTRQFHPITIDGGYSHIGFLKIYS